MKTVMLTGHRPLSRPCLINRSRMELESRLLTKAARVNDSDKHISKQASLPASAQGTPTVATVKKLVFMVMSQ